MRCPRCQAQARDNAKFCDACGARLAVRVRPAAPLPRPRAASARPAARACRRLPPADRFASPSAYTPEPPRREDPHLARRPRGRAQAGHRALRRPQELDGAARRPRPRGGAQAPRRGARAADGGGPPLRGHGEPGHGRRHHGPLRRSGRPRGSRRARLLRRPAHARARATGTPTNCAGPRALDVHDPRRDQLGRGRRAHDRQRPAHGLLGGRPDHAPGRPHGAARPARHDPGQPAHARLAEGSSRCGRSGRSRSRDCPSPWRVYRARRLRAAPLAHAGGGGARPHAASWGARPSSSSSGRPCAGRSRAGASSWRWWASPASASRGSSGSSRTPTGPTAGSSSRAIRVSYGRATPTCP